MIIGFRHKGLQALYEADITKGLHAAHVKKLRRIISLLDVASGPEDLTIPSFELHPMKGDLDGFWAVKVNGNYSVIFRFSGNNVDSVDYLDYHDNKNRSNRN